jgi:hypothetical protein
MKRFPWAGMLCCILSILSTALVFGQTSTTSLRGVVKDPSDALVPGAAITLANQATGNAYHAVTNSSGYYIFPIVVPERYRITVASSGFATQTVTAELLVGQPATINFTLTVKAEAVTVDVSATTAALNLTDATIGNAVESVTIETLPMEGRDPVNLLSLQPGVLYVGNEITDSRQGSVAGGRSDQGNVTLDGLDDNDQTGGAAFTGILRSTLDSTEEFRVTTSNGTAASGRSSGAQVDLVTKGGTNQQHGALYEYYRPTNTVANSFFNKYDELAEGKPNIPQKYVLNTFGGSTGGRIKKDNLFYFFNYEGQRKAISDVVGATVPTATFMAGELSYPDASGNTQTLTQTQVQELDSPCLNNTFNGAAVCPNGPGANAAVLAYYANVPTATGSVLGDGGYNSGSLFFTSPAPSTLNTSIIKIDYNMSSKHHFFVRGNLQKDTASGDINLPGQPPSFFTDNNTKGISAGYTWVPNANIVNDLRYGYIRQGYQTGGINPGEWVGFASFTQPEAQTYNTILHVPVNNITDTLSWNRGTHTISFGGNWRAITNFHSSDTNSYNGADTNPYYATTSDLPLPANMSSSFTNSWMEGYASLMGVVPEIFDVYNYKITGPTSGTALAEGDFVTKNFHSNEFEGYVQDAWHARRNITVTYGVRYTLLQTPYETNGQQITPTIDTDKWYQTREFAAQQGQVDRARRLARACRQGQPQTRPTGPSRKTTSPRASAWSSRPMQKPPSAPASASTLTTTAKPSSTPLTPPAHTAFPPASPTPQIELGIREFTTLHRPPRPARHPACLPFSPTQTFPFTPTPLDAFAIDWGIDNRIKTPYAEAFNLLRSSATSFPAVSPLESAYVGRLGRHLLQQTRSRRAHQLRRPPAAAATTTAPPEILSQQVDAAPFGTYTFTNPASVGFLRVNNLNPPEGQQQHRRHPILRACLSLHAGNRLRGGKRNPGHLQQCLGST